MLTPKGTFFSICLCLLPVLVLAQDTRLLNIEKVLVTPSDQDREMEEIEKHLGKELGWTLTDEISEADAIWVLTMHSNLRSYGRNMGVSGIYAGGGTGGYGIRLPHVHYEKKVSIFTNSPHPEKLWETERKGSGPVSKHAIKELKKALEKLKETSLE